MYCRIMIYTYQLIRRLLSLAKPYNFIWLKIGTLLILLTGKMLAQQTRPTCKPLEHSGQVVLNTSTGNGLAGVQIFVNGYAGPQTLKPTIGPRTDKGGNFRYRLADCPGSLVRVQALKIGYSVVNQVEMAGYVLRGDILPDQLQFLIILSADHELEQRRINYYSKIADLGFDKELARLRGRIGELEKLLVTQTSKNDALIDELATLKVHYQQASEQLNQQKIQTQQIARIFAKLAVSDIDSTYLQAFNLYKQGRLTDAQEYLSAENIDKELIEARHEIDIGGKLLKSGEQKVKFYINKSMLKASLYQSQYNFDEAKSWYLKAVIADSNQFENLYEFASFLRIQNQLRESEYWYNRALNLANNESQQALLYLGLGVLYDDNNQTEQALQSYIKSQNLYESLISKNQKSYESELARVLSNIGNLYQETNQPELALKFYLQSLNIKERLAKTNPEINEPDLPIILSNLGLFYQESNQPSLALKSYKTGLEILERLVKIDPNQYEPSLAILLNNLGSYYKNNNYPDLALNAYKKNIEINNHLIKLNTDRYGPDLANSLNSLAGLYEANNQSELALEKYKQSLSLYESVAKINPQRYEPSLALINNNLGNFYTNNNQPELALSYYQHSLSLYERVVKLNSQRYGPDLARVLNNLGSYYENNNQSELALPYYQRSLSLYEHAAKLNPELYEPYVAILLNNLGTLYEANDKVELALTQFKSSLKLYQRLATINPRHYEPFLASSLNNLALLYAHNSNPELALSYYQRSLNLYEVLATLNPQQYEPDLARVLNNLGSYYRDMNQLQLSVNFLNRSLSILQKLNTVNRSQYEPYVAITLSNLGGLYLSNNNASLARQNFSKCVNIQEHLAKINPQRYGRTLSIAYAHLAWSCLLSKDFVGAEEFRQKSLSENIFRIQVILFSNHILLYQGKFDDTKVVYDTLLNMGVITRVEILKDFDALEKAGVININITNMKNYLSK